MARCCWLYIGFDWRLNGYVYVRDFRYVYVKPRGSRTTRYLGKLTDLAGKLARMFSPETFRKLIGILRELGLDVRKHVDVVFHVVASRLRNVVEAFVYKLKAITATVDLLIWKLERRRSALHSDIVEELDALREFLKTERICNIVDKLHVELKKLIDLLELEMRDVE